MNKTDFDAEYNMPETAPPTLKDDRSYFGAGGDPTLKYPEWDRKEKSSSGASVTDSHARLKKMFLWPVAATLIGGTIILSSFGLDPILELGSGFRSHGDHGGYSENYGSEPAAIEVPDSISLTPGESTGIGAVVTGCGETDFPRGEPEIVYESSDTGVATVASDGTVTAVGTGFCVITVRCPALGIESTVPVTVSESGLSLSSNRLRMYAGGSARIQTYLVGRDGEAVDCALEYESPDPSVMTVEPDGTVIVGDDPGDYPVPVRCSSPFFESVVIVTVIRPEIEVNDKSSATLGEEWDLEPRLRETVSDDEKPSFIFETSDPELLSVTPDGRVTAVGEGGSATVTVICTEPYALTGITVTVDIHDHAYGEWTVTSEPSCTETGLRARVCSVCGIEDAEEIPLLDHDPVELSAVAATCTEGGKTAGSYCSVCGQTVVPQEDIAPLGHDYLRVGAVCSRCGDPLVTLERQLISTAVITTTLGGSSAEPIVLSVGGGMSNVVVTFEKSGIDISTLSWSVQGADDIVVIRSSDDQCNVIGNSAGTATVTASFVYNGVTYSVNTYYRVS